MIYFRLHSWERTYSFWVCWKHWSTALFFESITASLSSGWAACNGELLYPCEKAWNVFLNDARPVWESNQESAINLVLHSSRYCSHILQNVISLLLPFNHYDMSKYLTALRHSTSFRSIVSSNILVHSFMCINPTIYACLTTKQPFFVSVCKSSIRLGHHNG